MIMELEEKDFDDFNRLDPACLRNYHTKVENAFRQSKIDYTRERQGGPRSFVHFRATDRPRFDPDNIPQEEAKRQIVNTKWKFPYAGGWYKL